MNERQKSAIDHCVKDLTSALLPNLFLTHLVVNGTFSDSEKQSVQKGSDNDQMALFTTLNLLKSKKGGWDSLMGYLKDNQYGGQWVEDLMKDGSQDISGNTNDESTIGAQSSATPEQIPTPIASHSFWDSSDNSIRRKAQLKLGIDPINNYNFAVCGRTDTGKSSLINAICYAKNVVDVSATAGYAGPTTVPTAHPMAAQPHIVLWDCPSSEANFSHIQNYFGRNCLFAFDCLIVVTSGRLGTLDLKIAEQVELHDIPAVFVRSKADQEIGRKTDRGMSEFQAKVELRDKISPLIKVGQKCLRVFIVSSWAFTDPRKIQMDELKLLKFIFRQAQERRTAKSLNS